KTAFDKSVAAFNDGQTFTVQVEGEEGTSASSKARIAAVKNYLGELVAERIIQRKAVLDQLRAKGALIALTAVKYAEKLNGDLYASMYGALAFTHAKLAKLGEGTIVVHSSRASTISSSVTQEKDYEAGGFESRASAPDSQTAVGMQRDAYKKIGVVHLR